MSWIGLSRGVCFILMYDHMDMYAILSVCAYVRSGLVHWRCSMLFEAMMRPCGTDRLGAGGCWTVGTALPEQLNLGARY